MMDMMAVMLRLLLVVTLMGSGIGARLPHHHHQHHRICLADECHDLEESACHQEGEHGGTSDNECHKVLELLTSAAPAGRDNHHSAADPGLAACPDYIAPYIPLCEDIEYAGLILPEHEVCDTLPLSLRAPPAAV